MATPDPGHAGTDILIQKLEKEIHRQYWIARRDLNKKITAYLQSFAVKDAKKKQQLADGQITQEEYNNWRLGQIAIGERWKEMRDTIAQDLLNADQIAVSITNGYTPQAYALNHNYGTYEAEKGALVDTSYTLYDRYTVERLFRENPDLLPAPSVNIPKTDQWNKGKIQSAITQGILQGETIKAIADRLTSVTTMNEKSALRNARTAMTGAENAGRVDSYIRAQKMGIGMKQMWVATLDNKTRDSHAMLDGTQVDPGKRFPNGCKFPGDPAGPGEEVYNCRCTLVAIVEGADPYNPNLRTSEYLKEKGLTYDDWQKAHDTPAYQLQKAKGQAWKSNLDLQEFDFHTYHNIWRNDVTEKDYAAKKGAIQAKKDYFWKQWNKTVDPVEEQKWMDMITQVTEFERRGQEYEALRKQAQDDARAYANMLRQKKGQNPANDMFAQDRKDNAKWFKKSEYADADAYYDPIGQLIHANKTSEEHQGYYAYTDASGGMNRPIAGFKAPYKYMGASAWNPQYYVGPGNVDFDNEGKADEIRGLTSLINKSEYPDDVWLQTGQNFSFLEGFLGVPYDSIHKMKDADLQQFINERREVPQFISTSINRGGGGYNPGDIVVNIYCPTGSKMLYVEDDGRFRKSEHEMILQRGGQYEITKIYWGYDDNGTRKLFVDMDLHSELGYNLYEN